MSKSPLRYRYLLALALLSLASFLTILNISRTLQIVSPESYQPPLLQQQQDACHRVIVVGAGAAGLTAAKRLVTHHSSTSSSKCIRVQLLEASSNFGGRVQKDTTGFADYPLDLGASWVYDPERLSIMAQNASISRWMRHKTVAPVSLPKFESFKIRSNGKHEEFDMHEDDNHLWVNYTWHDFLHHHMLEPALEAGLEVVYDCPVHQIHLADTSTNRIRVSCERHDDFWADHVIVTAPLSILQSGAIDFAPPLPTKRLGLNRAKMWQGFKIFLEFSRKFYHDVFEYSQHDGELDFWDHSFVYSKTHQSQRHILAGYYIGEPYDSHFSPDMSEDAMVQQVLKDLDATFGRNRASRSYLRHLVIHWSQNPHIRGIYSNRPVSTAGPMDIWNHRLFLAGEAFPLPPHHNGWVDGAALSGLHAAERILYERSRGRDKSIFTIPAELLES